MAGAFIQADTPVHTFDPDASPQQKAASAGQGADKLDLHDDRPIAKELQVITEDPPVLPTITVEDVDKLAKDDTSFIPTAPTVTSPIEIGAPEDLSPPGAIPEGPAPAVPGWYKIGWRAVSGLDETPSDDPDALHKAALDAFISDQFYGEWYHNAAVLPTVVVLTHFLTRFHLGWGWLIVLLAVATVYYNTSMERFRRRARDDIQRELIKSRLIETAESADWMNNFLDRFWLIYEPVLSTSITASIDQVLSTSCPSFLDSLKLHEFTLGAKAPRIVKIKTHPNTEDDMILMDWDLAFTPQDVNDLPSKRKKRSNPKIVLHVRVGKGIAAATCPVLLENLSFSGNMRIRMKLMTAFPHIQIVDLQFTEKPYIDYVLKPIGGETFGFDIGNIPGLSAFLRNMLHSILGPMMYEPNFFTLNIQQMLSGEPLDAAVGVLQVNIHSARGLRSTGIGSGTPDPYISLSINQREELAKTRYRHNTINPTWMETKFLLVNNLTDSLVLTAYDYNDHRKNSELGFATFDLAALREDASQEGLELQILKDGKERGMVRFDCTFYPCLKELPGEEPIPETKVGIVRLTIHQAKDLDTSKSITNDLNPFARVYLSTHKSGGRKRGQQPSRQILKTRPTKHTSSPVFENTTEFLCSARHSSVIQVKLIDDRDFLKDPVVGYLNVRLEDLLDKGRKEKGMDWWPLSGCRGGGKVRLSAEWKPVAMAGSVHGAGGYVPPMGVVRLWLKKAVDVKNVEATLGGKSDPYVRVQVNNVIQGRTEVINNNLNPEWDQIIYIPVHSLKETFVLEVMDYQHLTKDRSLGYVELKLADLGAPTTDADKVPHNTKYKSLGKKTAEDPIRLDKGSYKGKLFYEAEFIPSLPVPDANVRFLTSEEDPLRAALTVPRGAGDDGESDAESVPSDRSSISSSDEEFQTVPDRVTVRNPVGEERRATNGTEHRRIGSGDTTKTVASIVSSAGGGEGDAERSASPGSGKEKEKETEVPPVKKEELLAHQSGIIIFNIISGQLQKKGKLDVLLDDAYWPAFSTVRARSVHQRWEYVGEGFVKELDFGRVWFRLNEADEGEKDDIIAEGSEDVKKFLDKAMDGPIKVQLRDRDDEDRLSWIEVEARYVPVPIVLEPRESINNQGVLSVHLQYGKDIHAADRGGKSDPFAVFQLNGQKVYKSQTKKKTLNPEWDEKFDIQIPSRVGADFQLELFDWNQIEQAKSLGSGRINLADLEPIIGIPIDVPLSSPKHGDKGVVHLNLVFRPQIVVKQRKNTSTFSSAGRAMTQIGHLPVGAGRGVIHGVTGVFRREKGASSDSEDDREKVVTVPVVVPDLPAGQASQPVGVSSGLAPDGGLAANGGSIFNGSAGSPGTLQVTVLDAKDLSMSDVKPYTMIRVGDKEHKTKHYKTEIPEWNETFAFTAGPSQSKLYAWVYDHKTLGKDKLLGSAEIDIWRHIQPGVVGAAEVMAELREGQGQLRLRLDFDPESKLVRSRASMSSVRPSISDPSSKPPVSPSRFSLSRRKADKDSE